MKSEDGEARTEKVAISFTKAEYADLNAMRMEANPRVAISAFLRSLILDVLRDDKQAHEDAA